jgi:hypothetical protein
LEGNVFRANDPVSSTNKLLEKNRRQEETV